MSEQNHEDLVSAIEHVSAGLEHLTMLALDLKRKLDEQQESQNSELALEPL